LTLAADMQALESHPGERGTQDMLGPLAAANALLVGCGALAAFHVLMLAGVLPADVAWGGRAEAAGSLVFLESVGLAVTFLFAAVVAAKAGYIGSRVPRGAVRVAMWVVFGYFVLNTAGNLASASSLERSIFTPVSAVLSLLALRLAVSREPVRDGR
jgi:hypothetical protein